MSEPSNNNNSIDAALLKEAEAQDRKMGPARIKQLKQSYEFFKGTGLDDDAIKRVMNLTGHEMRLIRKA